MSLPSLFSDLAWILTDFQLGMLVGIGASLAVAIVAALIAEYWLGPQLDEMLHNTGNDD